MHPVDAQIADIRSRARHACPQPDAATRKRVDALAANCFPGLIALSHRGQAEAFTARSLGVTPAARDVVLATASELERLWAKGREMARHLDSDACEVLGALVRHLAERWRLEREVGQVFQAAAEQAAEVRL